MFDFLTPQAILEPAVQFGTWLLGLYSHYQHEAKMMLWNASPTWLKFIFVLATVCSIVLRLKPVIPRIGKLP
jgi:hypothetical protein